MHYWNGSAWTLRQFGTNALADLSITNALIANAAINNAKIANIDAGKITTGIIDADRIGAGSLTVGKLTAAALAEIQKPAAEAKTKAEAAASAAAAAQGTANTAKTNAATAQSAADAAKATLAAWCYNNNLTYIDGGDIYTGTVTAAKIAAGAITADKFYGMAITSKNYVPNSAGTKIDLANGTIDTKNFKVDSAGNVAMTGTLTMQGAQSMTVKNASASLVGTVAFKAVSGQTWSPGALNVLGKDLLHLVAGDSTTTKAYVEGYVGGYNLFEMGREGSNYSVWMGTSPTARIGVSNAQSPQVYAEGCTKTANVTMQNGFAVQVGRPARVILNAIGNFVNLELCIYRGTGGTGGNTICANIPEGYRPTKEISFVAFEAERMAGQEVWIQPSGNIVLFQTKHSSYYLNIFTSYYID